MTEAEMAAAQAADGQAPAAGQELSIPKHRFDEILNENRRLKEEQGIKDQLYLQERQRALQPQAQAPQDPTPEETGLDPQVHTAVLKMAKQIAGRENSQLRGMFEQQLGILANRTEKAEFLASKGSDKAKYIPEIQKFQQQHYQSTGGYMPAETAFEIIRGRELEEKVRQLEAKVAGQHSPAPEIQTPGVQAPATNYPSAQGTRQLPTGGAQGTVVSTAAKAFSDLSVEEMEARLEEQFKSGART